MAETQHESPSGGDVAHNYAIDSNLSMSAINMSHNASHDVITDMEQNNSVNKLICLCTLIKYFKHCNNYPSGFALCGLADKEPLYLRFQCSVVRSNTFEECQFLTMVEWPMSFTFYWVGEKVDQSEIIFDIRITGMKTLNQFCPTLTDIALDTSEEIWLQDTRKYLPLGGDSFSAKMQPEADPRVGGSWAHDPHELGLCFTILIELESVLTEPRIVSRRLEGWIRP
ncbi:hypothetical protein EVAR_58153_1 [Eumeta japonica]|uniref:Uncharacterized protein n=1 Tax=Eumeta variegata TaxID=151549 RepID=A0A4C1X2Z3_EUMVA|nr:hypothetical protein EVAR_58153_1 [Eumeta japonica]